MMLTDDFYLFANVNFVPDRYDEWQTAYDALATHVFAAEPTTKTYYFGIPLDYAHDLSATTSMLAFEVYGKREDLYETHFHSAAMKEFLQKIPATMTTGLDLRHYRCVGGFLDGAGSEMGEGKEGGMGECGIMCDTRIVCKDGAAREGVSGKLRRLAGEVERLAEAEDSGVFTFMVFDSLDDETGVRMFARFRCRDDMERHLRRKEVLDFWLGSKEQVATMESRGYLPNEKGWLHR
ncbi:hypothetical protein W97_02387 [Coniosporium apollinis CBS 100218]|uniref:ABM domain-containing protein n=1 Tax=Coniosporium apollinis (strain CBS 100218) TaxID=1168221 RepID=R7YML1_CONA1|nr:uncharacterized protein W97_02387 [Coniosporium apollinis CBS 100218]EON63160.1 hypothetical protein W97_02387 [Coniosporium apollinis CBS 100218]